MLDMSGYFLLTYENLKSQRFVHVTSVEMLRLQGSDRHFRYIAARLQNGKVVDFRIYNWIFFRMVHKNIGLNSKEVQIRVLQFSHYAEPSDHPGVPSSTFFCAARSI